ncbi:lipoprotein, partial [Streptomyces sp. RSD-27]
SPELGSRVLEGLGSEGFLDDKLGAAGATAAQARTVRIVFRTSNVIVTVEYSVQPSGPGRVPPAAETQD